MNWRDYDDAELDAVVPDHAPPPPPPESVEKAQRSGGRWWPVVAAVLAAAVLLGAVLWFRDRPEAPATPPAAATTSQPTAAPAPPVDTPESTAPAPSAPQDADAASVRAAEAFVAAWRAPGTPEARRAGLVKVTTPRLATTLSEVDPATLPAPVGASHVVARSGATSTVSLDLDDASTLMLGLTDTAGRVVVTTVGRTAAGAPAPTLPTAQGSS
ncbi:hypothetical protein [Mobilicoccus caccae]|uniref:Uncharacterized protein n=1 Tax=Mobilicoccus caccae TaxID=1859295 RepID=A0ABQ6IZ87_9MICO|nr:hypothetical protein [Mobilicoccus caccae]GMA42407.1 hypothetical protein GCM10025883_44520 [Mobilicoccus caccae]GMA42482.1 hypothetical protein GCM10025883_45270 [Mobilicoccus caccae]